MNIDTIFSAWKPVSMRELTPEERVDTLCRAAEAINGLTANEKTSYTQLVSSSATSVPVKTAMLQMSGCALTVLGLYRMLGLQNIVLQRPYKIGMAVADVIKIAKDNMAWEPAPFRDDYVFAKGDTVIIGTPEHVYTIVSEPEVADGQFKFKALNGGRKTQDGTQLIEIADTWVNYEKGVWTSGSILANGVMTSRKNVMGVVEFYEFGDDAWNDGLAPEAGGSIYDE